MATSSSDESSSAPIDFDLTSSVEENNSKYCFNYERCPLCLSPKRKFYCKYCVRSGDFVRTPYEKDKESFSQKKSKQLQLRRDKLLLLSNLTTDLEKQDRADKLKLQISNCKENIRLLKLALEDAKEEVKNDKGKVVNISVEIKERCSEMNRLTGSIERMHRSKMYYGGKIIERKKKLCDLKTNLKEKIRSEIKDLVEFIFPISRVCFDEPQGDSLNQATISALAEATQTDFVSGRWIYRENSKNIFYRIVEPLLPANGDYSAYSAWVESNRASVPSTGAVISNEHKAYGISAALTYLCQLVILLSFYLDVLLPYPICFSDFCSIELDADKFQRKVAKLNANILHLCLLQNVNPKYLEVDYTAANLAHLLDQNFSDLGRSGPADVDMDPAVMKDLDILFNFDTESVDKWGEWEEVHIPEIPLLQTAIKPSKQQQTPGADSTTSATGGLMQSAAATFLSFLKTATGQK